MGWMLVSVNSWGTGGHQMIASIAESLLTNQSLAQLELWDIDIVDESMWADNNRRSWSKYFHYEDTPDNFTSPYGNNCSSTGCISRALTNYTQRFINLPSTGITNLVQKQEALKFLIHFVADIHQPLHVGNASNGGGQVCGRFSMQRLWNATATLHTIWDKEIIDYRNYNDFWEGRKTRTTYNENQNFINYTINLISRIEDVRLTMYNCALPYNLCPDIWMQEGRNLLGVAYNFTCTGDCYRVSDGCHPTNVNFQADYNYYVRSYPIVETRLILAGIRLANLLNSILVEDVSIEDSSQSTCVDTEYIMSNTMIVVGVIECVVAFITGCMWYKLIQSNRKRTSRTRDMEMPLMV